MQLSLAIVVVKGGLEGVFSINSQVGGVLRRFGEVSIFKEAPQKFCGASCWVYRHCDDLQNDSFSAN